MAGCLERGERGVLATVVRATGSTPQVPGAKLFLSREGLVGTVGGGRIEEVVIETMRETLGDGRPRWVEKHLAHDLGMCCGGSMGVFVEPIEGRAPLLLFGAGHVAMPTAHFANRLGFEVTVVDPREDLNTKERFPDCKRVLLEPAEAVERGELPFGPQASIVISTHDHALDEEALRACLGKERRYLGMIGSKRKAIRVLDRVRARVPDAKLDEVHTPIGLDLGAVTPEEIALSICAELVLVRRGGKGGPMRLGSKDAPE